MNDFVTHLQMGLAQIAMIAVVIALAILWLRKRSGWALLALIGELGALACNLGFVLAPSVFSTIPAIRVLWSLNACIFAFGLLGYAWSETAPRRDNGTSP